MTNIDPKYANIYNMYSTYIHTHICVYYYLLMGSYQIENNHWSSFAAPAKWTFDHKWILLNWFTILSLKGLNMYKYT